MPHAIARKAKIAIAAILAPRLIERSQIRFKILATRTEQRANDREGPVFLKPDARSPTTRIDSRQPPRSRSAH